MPCRAASVSTILCSHARKRAQQRAIPYDLLDVLLDHGARAPAGAGAEIVHFDGRARAACVEELGKAAFSRYERKLASSYAIVSSEGVVITVGHRFRRIGRR
jgi:hypothetical protein